MSRTSMNGTLTIQMFKFLEDLYAQQKIKDYTYDGWIQIQTDWVPIEFGMKKLGDNFYNEYLEHRRQRSK